MRSSRCCIGQAFLCLLLLFAGTFGDTAVAQSLRFFGTGSDDVDRVKIPVDGGQSADIGATDFTIELWLRTTPGNNAAAVTAGASYNWIFGNTFLDRDLYDRNPGFGASLTAGVVTFGVKNAGGAEKTWRAATDIRDGNWHHVAITRNVSSGVVQIYIDGVREGSDEVSDTGPTGDLSYPGGTPIPQGQQGDRFMVLGAEKHDAGSSAPSYFGYMTELRLSTTIRYSGTTLVVPTAPFANGSATAALYHFDEGSGVVLLDSSAGGSHGDVRFSNDGMKPQWSASSPFSASTAGSLQLAVSSVAVAEGAGSIQLSVTRTGGSSGAVAVSYSTTAVTASSGSDFTAASGTLQWAGGNSATQTLTIPVADDLLDESNETFSVTLTGPTNGATLGTPASTTVTINDNDPPPAAGTLQFSVSTLAVSEGQTAAQFSVSRTNGSQGAALVNFSTANGTAAAGSDYAAAAGTLTWASGETGPRSFSIAITDDASVESVETFVVALSAASGAVLGAPSSVAVSISDNDTVVPPPPPPSPPGSLQFAASTVSHPESQATMGLTVERTNGSSGDAAVNYVVMDGSAVAGSDYGTVGGTLTWANGEAGPRTISIPIIDDTVVEGSETFTVTLTGVVGATLGSPASVLVTLSDNDVAVPPPPVAAANSGGGGGTFDLLSLALGWAGWRLRRRTRRKCGAGLARWMRVQAA